MSKIKSIKLLFVICSSSKMYGIYSDIPHHLQKGSDVYIVISLFDLIASSVGGLPSIKGRQAGYRKRK